MMFYFDFFSSSYSCVVLCLCCAQIEIYIVHNIVIERKQFPCESTATRAHTHREEGKNGEKKAETILLRRVASEVY